MDLGGGTSIDEGKTPVNGELCGFRHERSTCQIEHDLSSHGPAPHIRGQLYVLIWLWSDGGLRRANRTGGCAYLRVTLLARTRTVDSKYRPASTSTTEWSRAAAKAAPVET